MIGKQTEVIFWEFPSTTFRQKLESFKLDLSQPLLLIPHIPILFPNALKSLPFLPFPWCALA